MNIEVGEYYLRADKTIIHILEENKESDFPFMDSCYNLYMKNGESCVKDDLIAHIPESLLFHISQMISTYHTQKEFKEKVDEVYKIFEKEIK